MSEPSIECRCRGFSPTPDPTWRIAAGRRSRGAPRISRGRPDFGRRLDEAGRPDVWLVCRFGPVPPESDTLTLRGYVALCEHGTAVARLTGRDDRTALEALRSEFPEELLACEPGMAAAAERLGLPVLRIDGARLAELAMLNLMFVGPLLRDDEHDVDLRRFLTAGVRFARLGHLDAPALLLRVFSLRVSPEDGAPKRYRVCVVDGSTDAGPGVFLLDSCASFGTGPSTAIVELPGARLAALFHPTPDFFEDSCRRAFGVSHIPLPVRFGGKRPRPTRRDVDILSGALECLSSWCRDERAHASFPGLHIDLEELPREGVLRPFAVDRMARA